MADEVRNISVHVQGSQAISQLVRLATSNDKLAASTQVTDAATGRLVRQLLKSVDVSMSAARSVARLKDEYRALSKQNTANANEAKRLEARLTTANKKLAENREIIRTQRAIIEQSIKRNVQLADSYNKVGTAASKSAQAQAKNQIKIGPLGAPLKQTEYGYFANGAVPLSVIRKANAETQRLAQSQSKLAGETGRAAKSAKSLNDNVRELTDITHINALRYAMYDVSSTFARLRDISYGLVAGIIGAGIEFDKNFAHVARTSELVGEPLERMRDAFIELQTTIPVSSEELARIGTLAAQMGIATEEIANFTEVTAKFSATSGVTIEESATALARVGMLLRSDVQGDYERLASAILRTGINAIATEQQIVRGTTQIAAMGRTAGLSAVDVVALSSAMSSLGMSPELQRSVITSSFTRILAAVRGTTQQAEKFGEVLGMTGREFQEAWNNDAYNTYNRFLQAIANSPNAVRQLQEMRLASQRLTPNLLRMGQSFELLAETHRDTTDGWNENIDLSKQYSVIAAQTAAAIEVMGNAWEALMVAMGRDATKVLGDVVRTITEVIKGLTEFANHPVGKHISNLVVLFGSLVAGATALVVALTSVAAGALGMAFVWGQLNASGNGVVRGLSNVIFGFKATEQTANRATFAVTALSRAFKLLGLAALAYTVVPLAADAINWVSDKAVEGVAKLDTVRKKVDGFANNMEQILERLAIGEDVASFALSPILNMIDTEFVSGKDWSRSIRLDLAFRTLDEDIAKQAINDPLSAAKNIERLRRSWRAGGGDVEEFNYVMRDSIAAMRDSAATAGYAAESVDEYVGSLVDAEEASAQEAIAAEELATRYEMIADALGILEKHGYTAEEAVKGLAGAFKSGTEAFFDFGSMLDRAFETDPKKGLGKGITQFAGELDKTIDDFKAWEKDIQGLVARGASHLAMELIASGPGNRKAVKQALKLSDEDLAELEDNMALAAYLSSQAYADAFAADNAILAEVHKQTGSLEAVRETIKAIRSGGGLTPQERKEIEDKFAITIPMNLNPDAFLGDLDSYRAYKENLEAGIESEPITLGVTGDFVGLDNAIKTWIVTDADGYQLIMDIDPNTDEGARIVQEWRNQEERKGIEIQAALDLSQVNQALRHLRRNVPRLVFPGQVTAFRDGGMVAAGGAVHRSNYPRYASGTIVRGPGSGTSDSILARISNGEAITRARAVRYYGTKMMEDINKMKFPRYATGYTPSGGRGGNYRPGGAETNVTIIQNNPVTRDPLRQLREDSEMVAAGVWG